jgi:ribosomal protein S18 acetylase RimI-like enzyme
MRTTLASCDDTARAAAFNAVYAQYLMPFTMTPEQTRRHIESTAIDPTRSPLWLDDTGAVQAMAALGIRSQRGWIGGLGIAPAYRGQRLGHALLRETLALARRAGLRHLELEVLVGNAAAIHVYECGGFRRQASDLIGLAGVLRVRPAAEDGFTVREVGLEQAHEALADLRPVAPCWQREDETVRRLPALHGALVLAQERNQAALVYRVSETDVVLADAAARTAPAATALIQRLAADWPARRIQLSNEPEGSTFAQALLDAGCTEVWRQHRMVCTLSA